MYEDAARSYFDRFVDHGFKANKIASFDDEFQRLAAHMEWTVGGDDYRKQLSLAELMQLEHTAASANGSIKSFTRWFGIPDNTFDHCQHATLLEQFKAFAEQMKLERSSEKYSTYLRVATVLSTSPRPRIPYFDAFVKNDGFVADPSLSVSEKFARLETHMGWPAADENHKAGWAQAMSEALKVSCDGNFCRVAANMTWDCSDQETKQQTPSTKASANDIPAVITHAIKNPRQADKASPTTKESQEGVETTSAYFASFRDRGFISNPNLTIEKDFDRLALRQGWKRGSHERRREWSRAVEAELVWVYGPSHNLKSWKKLARDLGIVPPPEDILDCRATLKKMHICITHFIGGLREVKTQQRAEGTSLPNTGVAQDAAKGPSPPLVFSTEDGLEDHCNYECRFFPKFAAERDWFLDPLLRKLTKDEDRWEKRRN